MRKVKKALAWVFTLSLVLTMVFGGMAVAHADSLETELKAEKSGEDVVVTLTACSDATMGGVSGTFTYDKEAFELKEIASETLDCDSNLETGAFSADSAKVEIAAGDVLVTFTLSKKDAFEKNKEYTFEITFDEVYDVELEDLDAEDVDAPYAENTFTVTFDSDGGSEVEAQEVDEGEPAEKPEDPTKEGFTFKGWQLDGEDFDFETPITESITLKAVWEEVKEEEPEEPTPPDDESPDTGDTASLGLWGSLLPVSAAGAVAVVTVMGRKRGKREM